MRTLTKVKILTFSTNYKFSSSMFFQEKAIPVIKKLQKCQNPYSQEATKSFVLDELQMPLIFLSKILE